ncbi:nitrite reductase [Sulfurisoma sediminicola]|uniref:Cbb3-type cytochrome c oxidase subunit III n=1 Tax=Sulfurisoma sediminicola TaxID=1381557 RepID=A0A497X8X9_9PROT|nr:nitrite reductase [Sulfurisoma sediminicola]RLJ62691.1 cbb3-type cytochrome c oxidase subunit III [Sulfurisoma sediminicola]
MRGLIAFVLACATGWAVAAEPQNIFRQHCVACHGPDRLGITGPALLPESLERLRKPEAIKTVREGRAATQMEGFRDRLSTEEIEAVVNWIYTPVSPKPAWTEAQIRESRIVNFKPGSLPDKPAAVFDGVDMMNLFIVVETGDHHVTVLDGDKLEPIHRFPSRYALHGGPKFTPDGRYVFFASRDGWVSKFDLWNLKVVAEIRAGINTRNVAVSGDGKYVAVANYLPHTLVLLDADLNLLKVHPVRDKDGKESSRVSAVYDAAPRQSFVAALKDVPEVWEISYDPKAEDVPVGMIHDFKYKEGAFIPGFLNPRRTFLSTPLDDFFFTQDYSELMGAAREGGGGQVVNLDARKKVADLDLPGMPHLGSGITWDWNGRRVMASPNLKEGMVSVIDLKSWQTVKQIPTRGPGFFMRSHEATPYAWTDSMMSKAKDTLQIIDKRTLERVAEVKVAPGKTLAHVEFTRDGKYALASLWERKADGGALVVFDAATFKEVKRIPMDKPVGKYNLYNKITRSEGTSH